MADDQKQAAERFRRLHQTPLCLLRPTGGDPMSARIFEADGVPAVATTSGGLAWALGYADGEQAPWAEVVAATARIARIAGVPVSADIEAGYGETPAEVAAHVA